MGTRANALELVSGRGLGRKGDPLIKVWARSSLKFCSQEKLLQIHSFKRREALNKFLLIPSSAFFVEVARTFLWKGRVE